MKKTLLLLTILATLFTACDDDPLPGNDPSGGTSVYTNYYNSNDLHKRQLKGAVKMIRTVRVVEKTGSYTDITDEFDIRGNIVKSTSRELLPNASELSSGNTTDKASWLYMEETPVVQGSVSAKESITDYAYDAFGRLSGIYRHGFYTILLRYGNHGAYIPFSFIYDNDMKQNIAEMRIIAYHTESVSNFRLEGSVLKTYKTSGLQGDGNVTYDTVEYKLNTAKMPVSYDDRKRTKITYAYYPDNIMLKEVMQEFTEPGDGRFYKATFLEDSTSQLKATVECTYAYSPYSNYNFRYTYNDRKDLQKIRYNNSESSYIYDAFDANGNWTERTIGGNGVDGTFVAGEKEYRSIVYY